MDHHRGRDRGAGDRAALSGIDQAPDRRRRRWYNPATTAIVVEIPHQGLAARVCAQGGVDEHGRGSFPNPAFWLSNDDGPAVPEGDGGLEAGQIDARAPGRFIFQTGSAPTRQST